MQLASRSYLTAGVALVGAGAIAVSPLAPPAPDIHLPAIDASSAAVNLTASANPLELWAEVIGAAFENVSGLGEQLAADPAPILRQIIANQLHSANVLGTATQGLVEGMAAALDPENSFSFQAALKDAADQIAAGQFTQGFTTLLMSPLMLGLPLLSFVGNPWAPGAWSVIAQPLQNLANVVTALPDGLPALLLNGVIQPLAASGAASGSVLEQLAAAGQTGDVAEMAATLVNAPATITGALLNGFDLPGEFGSQFIPGLLSAPKDQWGSGAGAISTVLSTLSQLADTLATPGADRGNLFGSLPSLGTAPETVTVTSALAPAAKTVTLDVAKPTEISAAPAASQSISTTQESAAEEAAASSSTSPATDSDDAAPTVSKLSTKASPKAAKGQAKANSTKAVRDQVKSTVKKLTDGLKKDKPSTPKKAESSTDSAKGGDTK